MALEPMKKGMKFYQDPKFKKFIVVFAAIVLFMFFSWYFKIEWIDFITS